MHSRLLKINIILLSLFLIACGQDRDFQNDAPLIEHQAKHIDRDFLARGANQARPWHLHTGRGFMQMKFPTAKGEKSISSPCEISYANPECKEKVYFFSKTEIMNFTNTVKKFLEKKLETHIAWGVFSGTMSGILGKTAIGAIFYTPEPVVSKIAGGISALLAGASGIFAVWEGKKATEVIIQMNEINDLIASEEVFVSQCDHLRKNFLPKAQDLGIIILFPENGGSLIDGKHYLESKAKEDRLIEATKLYAQENQLSMEQAYNERFSESCGQLPMQNIPRNDLARRFLER